MRWAWVSGIIISKAISRYQLHRMSGFCSWRGVLCFCNYEPVGNVLHCWGPGRGGGNDHVFSPPPFDLYCVQVAQHGPPLLSARSSLFWRGSIVFLRKLRCVKGQERGWGGFYFLIWRVEEVSDAGESGESWLSGLIWWAQRRARFFPPSSLHFCSISGTELITITSSKIVFGSRLTNLI